MPEQHEGPDGPGSEHLPAEQPPADVVEAAKAAFPPGTGELASLVFDSLVDAAAEPGHHQLRFEHVDVMIELEVAALPDGARIRGHMIGSGGSVVLHVYQADLAMRAEMEGNHFEFHTLPHGLVRLSIEDRGPGPEVWTDWFRA